MPAKQWNFRKAKWSHYIALTNKSAKTLLPPDSLDVDAVPRTSVKSLKKQSKRLFRAIIETTIFRAGRRSANLSIERFCSLLREMTRVWLLQLCLPSLTGSGGIDGPRQFEASIFLIVVEKHKVF